MIKKHKSFLLPFITFICSIYLSLVFAIGMAAGYLATNIFCKKYIETKKMKTIVLSLGDWKLHLHHWLSGILIALGLIFFHVYALPTVALGALGGMVFHDLYTDKEWSKVIYKDKE